jgi:hypothetical protein
MKTATGQCVNVIATKKAGVNMDEKELIEKYREICILHPTYRNVPSRPYRCMLDFMLSLCQHGFKPILSIVDFTYLPFSRNMLAEAFASEQAQRRALGQKKIKLVFWMDSDHNFSFQDFLTLLHSFDEEKAAAMSARYLIRQDGKPAVCAFLKKEDGEYSTVSMEETGIKEADAVGMGFFLMKPEILEKAYLKKGRELFTTRSSASVGDDMIFCETLKELGEKILVNHDVKIGHEGGELRG